MARFYSYSDNETRGSVSPKYPLGSPQTLQNGEYFTVSAYVNPSFTAEPCFFDYWEIIVKDGGTVVDETTDSSPTVNLLVEDNYVHTYIAHFITQSEVITSDKGLTFRLKNNKDDVYYDFGEIQSVDMEFSAKVTQKAIITFDYQNALCYDMGVSKSYSFDFVRVNPTNPDKNPNNTRNWSNADWIRGVKQLINRWQGQHNGFKMYLVPDSDNIPHFPMYIDNVFVSGSLSHKKHTDSSSQAISGTISLAVGSLYGLVGQSVEMFEVHLHSQFPSGWGERANDKTYIEPSGTKFILSRDSDWDFVASRHYGILKGFKSEDGTVYPIGSEIETTHQNMHFYAVWGSFLRMDIITSPAKIMKIESVTDIVVWLVGGGGRGGNGSWSTPQTLGGGGGGGGAIREYRYINLGGTSWDIEITQVGSGGNEDSPDGTDTIAKVNGEETNVAEGGKKGGDCIQSPEREPGKGGEGGGIYLYDGTVISNNGGDGGDRTVDERGKDGEADGNGGGRGGTIGKPSYDGLGGGGGGSYNEIIDILTSNGRDIRAGNGYFDSSEGRYGCGGGGGGRDAHVKNGGDGFAIVIQY